MSNQKNTKANKYKTPENTALKDAVPFDLADFDNRFNLNVDPLPKDVYATAQRIAHSVDISNLSSAAAMTQVAERNKEIATSAFENDGDSDLAKYAIDSNERTYNAYLRNKSENIEKLKSVLKSAWSEIKGWLPVLLLLIPEEKS